MVAATIWTNLLGCGDFHNPTTLAAITVFGRATWGRFGGEPVTGKNQPLRLQDPANPLERLRTHLC